MDVEAMAASWQVPRVEATATTDRNACLAVLRCQPPINRRWPTRLLSRTPPFARKKYGGSGAGVELFRQHDPSTGSPEVMANYSWQIVSRSQVR